MATLWIREYERLGSAGSQYGGPAAVPAPQEPGTDQTPVTFTTSAASAAFGATTKYISIVGSAAFHYVVGSDPTATTSHLKVPADTMVTIGVAPGQKIAAIAAA